MLKIHVSDADLKHAVELISSECFGAMNLANLLGGLQTTEWQIIHNNTWKEIVEEAKKRNLPFHEMKCAVTNTPVTWSATFRYAMGEIDDLTRKQIFYQQVKKTGEWLNPNI